MAKFVLFLGVMFALTAVIAGALGDHIVLKMIVIDTMGEEAAAGKKLNEIELSLPAEHRMSQYLTGVRYQMYHGLGMIALGIVMAISARGQMLGLATALVMLVGVKLFSGTLYVISSLGMTQFTMLVPIGGTLLIVSWVMFLIVVLLFEPLVDKEDLD